MTLRVVLATAWALATGLAGGWLLLSPWALATQGSGDWTTATRTQLFSGMGLIVLAVIGLILLASQVLRQIRASGMGRDSQKAAQPVASGSPELDSALVELATALAADLRAQEGAPLEEPAWRRQQ